MFIVTKKQSVLKLFSSCIYKATNGQPKSGMLLRTMTLSIQIFDPII